MNTANSPLRNNLVFVRALIATNLRASMALRGAFLLQSIFMMANNFIFFTVWWIFFQNFEEIRGWRLPDMAALYAITAGAFGLTVVFGGGARQISRMVSDGELDGFMTQPKNLLMHVVGSHSFASGWGDILSCGILLAASGYATPERLPLILIILLCSTVVFLASAVMIHCLAFWMGPTEQLARQLFEFVITFSVYPQNIFSGFLKLFLFTVIPAGFIGFLPVELLRNFSWLKLAALVGGAAAYSSLAYFVFQLGLKRYESGNQVVLRG